MTPPSFSLPVLLAPVLLGLALAACQQPANDTDIAIDNVVNAAEAANAEIETLPPSEEGGAPITETGSTTPLPTNDAAGASANSPSTAIIPARYRGRWGMNANDCDPVRSDNKGLIIVAERTIRFYEATATLKEQQTAIATSFSGRFGFAGEGQTWERVETLTRNGEALERRSTSPRGEIGDALTYRRCA